MASSTVIPNRPQASATTVCILSAGVWCGLKLLPSATGTPASISARAGASRPSPQKHALGSSVAMMPAAAPFQDIRVEFRHQKDEGNLFLGSFGRIEAFELLFTGGEIGVDSLQTMV